MELKEILEQQVEVKNYKNDKPCDFRKRKLKTIKMTNPVISASC